MKPKASLNKLVQILLFSWITAVAVVTASSQVIRPECEESCGSVSIPYPFGTSENCSLNKEFLISCNNSFTPPKLFLGNGNVEVTDISPDGELRILTFVSSICYNEEGEFERGLYDTWISYLPFPFYTTLNKFTAVGCDTYAKIEGRNIATGCVLGCDSMDIVTNGSCAGLGCCQTSIPKNLYGYNVSVRTYENQTKVWKFNPCSYAFVVEEKSFNFTSADLKDLRGKTKVHSVLEWAVGNQTCEEVKNDSTTSFACQANSYCYDSEDSKGYRCNCSSGYHGNPYLPLGCQDIDECNNESLNDCEKPEYCINEPVGSYTCSCPKGHHGDGKEKGKGEGCIAHQADQSIAIKVVAGIIIGLFVLLFLSSWIYWGLMQRKRFQLKEKYYEQNGGLLLREKLSNYEGSVKPAIIFTEEDLKKATNNYHENRVLGKGGQGIVYKGILSDNREVAIKKSTLADQGQVHQFINEVIVLSQVNHRNVVKLLGCCLETQVPLLVYEFVTNGTLFDYIQNAGHASSILWKTRLRMATETARALSYLHSEASTPILHRDVKTANILLDDDYTAKVSDFGASRLIPLDKDQLTTFVQGTLGYLDPEYFLTGQLTEKSDVYSFGVVLVELLTGKRAISSERVEKERNLAMYFISSLKEDRLFEILDDRMLNEGSLEQIKKVSMLAKRCLRLKGEERPTMREVEIHLEGLRGTEVHGEILSEETELLLSELSDNHGCGTSSNTAGYDSISKQVREAFDIDGR